MQENLKHVSDLYETAVKADLDLGFAASLSDDRLAELYNGCGPEWLPARIREKLTRLLALFEPAFLIHDCDYSAANGSTGDWAVANDRLEMNCLALANYTYPWYSWRRYRARFAALEIASLCRRYGWTAYVSAAKKLCAVLLVALALTGCNTPPRAKDIALKGMYGNAASETLAIGSVRMTLLPDSIESFVAHYDEDTGWLNSSMKLRRLDIYMTGTNCTASASNVVDSICRTLGELKSAANPDSQAEPDSKEVK